MSDQVSTQQAAPAVTDAKKGPAGPPPAPPRQAAPPKFKATVKKWTGPALVAAIVLAAGAYFAWQMLRPAKLPPGFASSNGRIEATEIDIATKQALRIKDELVDEGDFVTAGQVVAHMDVETLKAERADATAKREMAESAVESARSILKQRRSEKAAAEAVVKQREAELDLAQREYNRVEGLNRSGSATPEELDTRRSALFSAKAALATAKANVAAADAAIATAQTTIITTLAAVRSARATIDRVQADINDSTLKAPRSGRVQYRVAQPGEMLPGGGKVMNMIDLNDVYMTFFLPTDWAGKVKVGAEARIVLDAAPEFVIPAKVTFVADVAQFTPKTVETAVERQKLTFRLKAHIPAQVLKKYVKDVKTGLPGVAYVQLDPAAQWPAHLEVKLPQ
jgi:HlyD family secretion protein